ncbi:MAG: di-heme oxidoredictase family protein, partial [Polyangiales bacterium]
AHVLEDGRLGRFGWKANVPSIREFVRDALSAELGLTVPDESGQSFGTPADDDEAIDPEVDVRSIDAIASFIEHLAPPPRTRTDVALEDRGEAIFGMVGCEACHVPTLRTADGVDVRAYTDLLLHDIAEHNALGIEEGDAGLHEFRTSPLWGLARSAPYLHDGRASTIDGAVTEHAGEAAASRTEAANLSTGDKEALFAFLRSL